MRNRLLLVGLGNPGKRYAGTRHNVGFAWIDALALEICPGKNFQERFESHWLSFETDEREIHLLKPQTFMNLSGRAVGAWRSKYQGPYELIVFTDDLDIPLGRLRLRPKGGDGGHRGLRSVIETLGNQDFARLRIGVGRERAGEEVSDFVLEGFRPEEKSIMRQVLEKAPEFSRLLWEVDLEKAMNKINSFQVEKI